MQLLWRIVAAAVVSLTLFSCNSDNDANESPPPGLIRLSINDRKALITGAYQLSIGMPVDQVLRILGNPSYDNIVGPKIKTKENDYKFHRILRYYLVQYDHGPNSADETLEVEFDRNGKAISSVTFINVREISDGSFVCSTAGNVHTCALRETADR